MFHLICGGVPISFNSKSDIANKFKFSINSLYLFSPIFFAILIAPMLEDCIKISSTDILVGNSCMSEITYLEHLIFFFISFIMVLGFNTFSFIAKATVNVLKIEPNSYKPFVILFVNRSSFIF